MQDYFKQPCALGSSHNHAFAVQHSGQQLVNLPLNHCGVVGVGAWV
jgi:hypothetical protein